MPKMWAGRTAGITDRIADDFNSSIGFDSRMYAEDIAGSVAHAKMLANQGIISAEDAGSIIETLNAIKEDIEGGALEIDISAEDIHMFIEQELTTRIGAAGKRLHTARSRNDQVALDTRLYTVREIDEIVGMLDELLVAIAKKAADNLDAIMPGYTHLQHAQPILFSHHIMAYAMMFIRDRERLLDCRKRTNISPIGCCALAGTTYVTDRFCEAELLEMEGLCVNSLDGVSDRDFCVELISDLSIIMMHLSRLSEEIILWASQEFGFVELSDAYTTGSSIMPQKKNPDMAELCRGKTGRVYGDLIAILTMLKGLPLAYNKDMQEDKESLFDAIDTVKMCIEVFIPMFGEMRVCKDAMYAAAGKGFMNATDLADYMTRKGIPFRDAYRISGEVVADCISRGCKLEEYGLEDYRKFSDVIEEDVYDAIDLKTCVNSRRSFGGTSADSVLNQIKYIEGYLKNRNSE